MGFNENIRSRSRPCLRDYTRLRAQQFRPQQNTMMSGKLIGPRCADKEHTCAHLDNGRNCRAQILVKCRDLSL